MKKIQTILFDLDGTLIDSREDLSNAVNFSLKSVGLPLQPIEEIVPHIGNGLRILLGEVMGPVSDEVLDKAIHSFSVYYDEHCVDQTVLYENVRNVLAELDQSHRLGVVTNKSEHFSQKIINKLGVSDFLDVIIGGDSLPERKPHPAPVLKAMRDLGAQTESVLIVGDGFQDVQAGQAAGVRTCLARYGFGFRTEWLDLKPDFQINRFLDLKEIVL